MTTRILTLRITLNESDPEIWRQVVVDNRITLAKLHLIIQAVMGWENYHLQMFTKNREMFGVPSDDLWGPPVADERRVKLARLLPPKGSKMMYEYDFGDRWEHLIEVVATRQYNERKVFAPILLDGARACPPEDVGGIWRYNDYVKDVLPFPEHPEYEHFMEWVGEEFDPAAFDRNLAELQLNSI